MRSKRLLAATALLVLGLGLTSCGSDSKPTAGSDTSTTAGAAAGSGVSIKGFAFNPKSLQVAKGTTVTVTNDDSTTHTWTADDKSFDAGQLAPGKSATHTFDQAGSFSYHCEIHPSMKGTVVVS